MPQKEVDWQRFDKLLVIKRLRKLVGNWWQIQLNFSDHKGFLRGVPAGKFFAPINPICKSITQSDKGFTSCMTTVKTTTINSTNAKGSILQTCHAGFSTLSVPIRINQKFLGCVFADGFVTAENEKEQKNKIKNYLKKHFTNQDELHTFVDSIPVLSEKEQKYLFELIEMVVEEMLVAQSSLDKEITKVNQLKSELGYRYNFANMVGKSGPMQELYNLLERVCDSNALVLIQGENGTGKELIAKALHYNSKRKDLKFLPVNCGAFNENLLESELFGYKKGAFTGAVKDKIGLFEAVGEGTIFLDEIGDTSMQMQVKLLRILQEGTFTPVGDTNIKHSKARIVCATNKDLEKMVKNGTFREDLFYRLNVINVIVPPLRERKEDIPILVDHFIKKHTKHLSESPSKVSNECMSKLLDYHWPGNVRELENELERLVVLAGSNPELSSTYLSTRITSNIEAQKSIKNNFTKDTKLKVAIENLEKHMIFEGLKRTKWNKSMLAKELGISRAGLIMKVEKYGLDKRNVS